MTIIERIKKLEKEVKALRIIDSEDIIAENTGLGVFLHLEDYQEMEEGDNYEGYFKVIDCSTAESQKIAVIDGGFTIDDAPDESGYAVINDQDLPVAKFTLTITGTAYIYAVFGINAENIMDTPLIKQSTEREDFEENKLKILLAIVDWDNDSGGITGIRQQHHGMIYGYIFKTCAEADAAGNEQG